ncbi:hypothetical protein EKO27_g9037 [Xylaria grammica]|uniref:Uncharacterized protein n=1 Tax=Xylaria grammica TaxID=363999 RepID=A0A439CV77_9PEZI|nr:hypothetical protein EKO27_g9037 [Xylaria grammica]
MFGSGSASGPYQGASWASPPTQVPNMSNEEFKEFRKIYELQILPAITRVLDPANIGGQVIFTKRKFINIITQHEAPPALKKQIEYAVVAELREDLRAKISLTFEVGEVVRT